MIKPDFVSILRTLSKHQVDFIVVGGVCAVLHGAPISTFDLDLVHSRRPENVDRLLTALQALSAHYRTPGAEGLRPDRTHLTSPAPQLLMTRCGPLDLLGMIGSGRGYDELIPNTVQLEVEGFQVRVLDLPTLIKVKEEAAGEKDRAVLAILRRTLQEKSKS